MCNICQKIPCDKRCPNADPKPVCFCDKCGGDIDEGSTFYEIKIEGYPTFNLCEHCVDRSAAIAEVDDE